MVCIWNIGRLEEEGRTGPLRSLHLPCSLLLNRSTVALKVGCDFRLIVQGRVPSAGLSTSHLLFFCPEEAEVY